MNLVNGDYLYGQDVENPLSTFSGKFTEEGVLTVLFFFYNFKYYFDPKSIINVAWLHSISMSFNASAKYITQSVAQ